MGSKRKPSVLRKRAGRRPRLYKERASIGDLVTKSCDLTKQFIENESYPLQDRVDIAHKFALRHMPSEVKTTLSIEFGEKFAETLMNVYNRNMLRRNDLNDVIEVEANET